MPGSKQNARGTPLCRYQMSFYLWTTFCIARKLTFLKWRDTNVFTSKRSIRLSINHINDNMTSVQQSNELSFHFAILLMMSIKRNQTELERITNWNVLSWKFNSEHNSPGKCRGIPFRISLILYQWFRLFCLIWDYVLVLQKSLNEPNRSRKH